jgi:hypothetical protein
MFLLMIECSKLYIILVSFSIITFRIVVLSVNIISGFILILPVEVASQFDFILIYISMMIA